MRNVSRNVDMSTDEILQYPKHSTPLDGFRDHRSTNEKQNKRSPTQDSSLELYRLLLNDAVSISKNGTLVSPT